MIVSRPRYKVSIVNRPHDSVLVVQRFMTPAERHERGVSPQTEFRPLGKWTVAGTEEANAVKADLDRVEVQYQTEQPATGLVTEFGKDAR